MADQLSADGFVERMTDKLRADQLTPLCGCRDARCCATPDRIEPHDLAAELSADELEQRREMVDRLVAASKADREQRESDSCDRIEPHDAELERLRAERDEERKIHDGLVGQIAAMSLELFEVRGERDAALADAERMRLAMAMYGVGTDPNGFYAGTPGTRLRELESAAAELKRARPVLDAVAAWHQAGIWSVGHAPDLGGIATALRAVVEAWDTYTAKEAPVP